MLLPWAFVSLSRTDLSVGESVISHTIYLLMVGVVYAIVTYWRGTLRAFTKRALLHGRQEGPGQLSAMPCLSTSSGRSIRANGHINSIERTDPHQSHACPAPSQVFYLTTHLYYGFTAKPPPESPDSTPESPESPSSTLRRQVPSPYYRKSECGKNLNSAKSLRHHRKSRDL
jgi:hypothetical protein